MLPPAPAPLQAMMGASVVRIPHAPLRQLAARHNSLASALLRDCLVDGSILGQWLLSIGRRDARGRVAHLLCEMAVRYAQIGMVRGDRFVLPVTQEQLADALGLSPVHVNRSLKALREEGLARLLRGEVSILNWAGLRNAAEFDPAYLHLPANARQPARQTGLGTAHP